MPRYLRFGVKERMDVNGRIRIPLDTASLAPLAEVLKRENIESVAIGYLHSYANPAHERQTADLLAAALPGIGITLSSDVCPEAREYERFSTACANAYVQPRMARYLAGLRTRLADIGLVCPLMLMTSGGALTTLETAIRLAHPSGRIRSRRRRHPGKPHRAAEAAGSRRLVRHGRPPPPSSA